MYRAAPSGPVSRLLAVALEEPRQLQFGWATLPFENPKVADGASMRVAVYYALRWI